MMKNQIPKSYTIAAINVGATGMRIAIVDINQNYSSYKIINQEHIPGIQPNEEAIWDNIIKAYNVVLSKSSKKISDLKGFAVTSPGPIDRNHKQVLNTPNMNWSYVKVEEKLYRKINKPDNINIPLYLERDAIGITLAEQFFGYGHDLKNFAVIYIGTGIGAGFVFNGEVYYGVHDHAGEFGHGIIDQDSRTQCRCQNFGCLECFASGQSLIRYCQFAIRRGDSSILSSKINDLYYNDILEAANQGDEVALNAFKEFAKALGIGLSNLINYLDLEKVIISGPLSRASKYYLDKVREIAAKNVIFLEGDRIWSSENIVSTVLGYQDIEIAGCVASFINQHTGKEVK